MRMRIGVSLFVLWILFVGCSAMDGTWPNQSFSSETWKSTSIENRYVFYNDLAEKKILDNLPMKEVVDLLGEPQYKSPDGNYITYILKYASKGEYSLNAVYLLQVDFNAQKKVTRYFVRAD